MIYRASEKKKKKKKWFPLFLLLALSFAAGTQIPGSGLRTGPEPAPLRKPDPVPEPDPVALFLKTMTLREKVGQMVMVSPEQVNGDDPVTRAGEELRRNLETYPVGGICYFAASIDDREQVIALLRDAQSASSIGLFTAVDEEGGIVARIGNNPDMGTTEFRSMKYVEDEEEAEHVGLTIGSEIGELGFNLDFAPVADVDSNPNNPIIGVRAFSSDAEEAARLVSACVRGFRQTGTACTLKHFPGHGDTETDTHLGQAESRKTLEELRECEFLPFAAGIEAGAECVMVAHIAVPEVTGDDIPSSLNDTVIRLLREELGFNGLVVTDALRMNAVSDRFTSAEAMILAVEAGVDILLMPNDLESGFEGLMEAVESGTISEERIDESVYRILSLKQEKGLLPERKPGAGA